MAIDVDLLPLFDVVIRICKRTSTQTDGYPTPGYQTTSQGTTFAAHIERSQDLLRTVVGHEVVGRRKIFLFHTTAWTNTTNIPKVTDKIILPAGYEPRTPQIMMVNPVSDENGFHHVQVWTG